MKLSNLNIIRILTVTTLFVLALLFLYQVRSIVILVIAAFIITLILNPIVNWFQKYMPYKNRAIAVFITLLLLLGIIALIGSIIVAPLVKEARGLINQIGPIIDQFKQNKDIQNYFDQTQGKYFDQIRANVFAYSKQAISVIGNSTGALFSGISSAVFTSITVLILTLFMLLDTPRVINSLKNYIPKKRHHLYDNLQKDLSGIITKYAAGVLLVATIAGLGTFLILSILRAPYSLALSVAVAALDLVPLVGATLGAIIVVLVVYFTTSPFTAVVMIAYYLCYQIFENYILVPMVQKRTVKTSPLVVLIALLVGSTLGGMVGTLVAIPAAAFVSVAYKRIVEEGYIKKTSQDSSSPEIG